MKQRTGIQLDQVFPHYSNRRVFLALLVIASVFTNFVISFDMNLYFFSSPYIINSISTPDIYLGLSASSFTLGVIIFAPIGGYLFSRHSARKFLIFSIFIITVFSVLTAYVQNPTELVVARFLIGAGNGLLQGLIASFLGGLYPSKKGLLLSFKGISFSAGMLFGPWTESIFAPGFKIPFLISGLVGLASIILLAAFIPEVYMKRHENPGLDLGRLFNRNTTLTFMSIFFFGIGLFGFLGYFSHYMLSGLNYSDSMAALASSMLGIGGLILTLPSGYITDVWSKKYTLVLLFVILAVSSYGVFALHQSYFLMLIFAILYGGGYNGLINSVSAAAQEWADPRDLGHVSGATFSFYSGGGIIGGPLFGLLLPFSGFSTAGMLSVTLFMLLGLVCALLLKDRSQQVE